MRPARPRVALWLAALALAGSAGCYRYRTHVPGVVDMRTDGSAAEPARARAPSARDNELEALLKGEGATRRQGRVVVEDRHYWVAGFIPLYNTSAEEELFVLVDGSAAAREVFIGEESSLFDVTVSVVFPQVVPLIGYVLPAYTFVAGGEPIRVPTSSEVPTRAPRVDEPAPVLAPDAPQDVAPDEDHGPRADAPPVDAPVAATPADARPDDASPADPLRDEPGARADDPPPLLGDPDDVDAAEER